jgi:hypothetical protein
MPKAKYLPPHSILMHRPPPLFLHHSIALEEEMIRKAGTTHVIGIARLKLM